MKFTIEEIVRATGAEVLKCVNRSGHETGHHRQRDKRNLTKQEEQQHEQNAVEAIVQPVLDNPHQQQRRRCKNQMPVAD